MAQTAREVLPPWLSQIVELGQFLTCGFTLQYSDAEDTWDATLDGPGQDEHWEVKRHQTARMACEALYTSVYETTAPNGLTYRQMYDVWVQRR